MHRFFKNIWQQPWLLWVVYTLAALLITVQRLLLGRSADGYTSYENYLIFKNSFAHLVSGQNPYARFDAEHWDLYKYSPAFSLFMAPFSVLPDWTGLALWNLLNALILLGAILQLPLHESQRRLMGWFVLLELVTSLQNSQSNGLTAGLILWTWVAIERNQPWRAGWWTAAGAFLKIFGGFSAIPAMLYPGRWRFVIAVLAWGIFMALSPMVVIGPEQLLKVYGWWWELLRQDHAASIGLSVAGWLESWFGWVPEKVWLTGMGLSLLLGSIWMTGIFSGERTLSPLHGKADLKSAYRGTDLKSVHHILAWASVLIWVVIFNHKAESPTFIIAMCGVALWYLSDPQPVPWKKILLWTAFVLVSLSPTDLFPPILRKTLVEPYVLKAVPCILIWILITLQLFRLQFNNLRSARGDEH